MDENDLKKIVSNILENIVVITEKTFDNANTKLAVDSKTESTCDVANEIISQNTIDEGKINSKEITNYDSKISQGETGVLQFNSNTDTFPCLDMEKDAFSLREHREKKIENSETDSDSDTSSICDTAEHKQYENFEVKQSDEIIKTKDEVLPQDLPPIEKLHISIAADEKLLLLGKVSSVVGVLVIIQSSPDTPALNEDTVLFYRDRRIFGKVFEIFGPVTCPFYAVRFNSPEEIAAENIMVGIEVFCAPNVSEITQYIFLDQLKKLKGSDASWKDNNEPPEKHLDYSDDETERRHRAKNRGKSKDSAERSCFEKNKGRKIVKGREKIVEDVVSHTSRYPPPQIQMHGSQPRNLYFPPDNRYRLPVGQRPVNPQCYYRPGIDCDTNQHYSLQSNQGSNQTFMHNPYSQHLKNNGKPFVMDTRYVQWENYKM